MLPAPLWTCPSYTTALWHRIKPHIVFCCVFFTPGRIIRCLEVSQGTPIFVFARVWVEETVQSFIDLFRATSLPSRTFPPLVPFEQPFLLCVIDVACSGVYKYIQYPCSPPWLSGSSGPVFIPESMHICVSIQPAVRLLILYCMLTGGILRFRLVNTNR